MLQEVVVRGEHVEHIQDTPFCYSRIQDSRARGDGKVNILSNPRATEVASMLAVWVKMQGWEPKATSYTEQNETYEHIGLNSVVSFIGRDVVRLPGPIDGDEDNLQPSKPNLNGLETPTSRGTSARDSTEAENFYSFVKTWIKTLAMHINTIVNVEDNLRDHEMEIRDTRRAAAPSDTRPTTHTKPPRKYYTLL